MTRPDKDKNVGGAERFTPNPAYKDLPPGPTDEELRAILERHKRRLVFAVCGDPLYIDYRDYVIEVLAKIDALDEAAERQGWPITRLTLLSLSPLIEDAMIIELLAEAGR